MGANEKGRIPARDLIEKTRRRYGVGVTLTGEAKEVADNYKELALGLVGTIAEDLNSKDSHFILELVQNADDNEYPSGRVPSLSFRLEPKRLVVVNNERGFEEKHVKALCSAGQSSKIKKAGYIGEKGIGFKSVFKVSDAPEIHSNGFHFRFNRGDPKNPLGYVIPEWYEPTFPVDAATTTIVIPLKTTASVPAALLSEITSTLLLFLGKLRKLELRDATRSAAYERKDSSGMTTLTAVVKDGAGGPRTATSRYLRAEYSLSMVDIQEPKREEITETSLVLAFPVDDEGKALPQQGCPTFAFLPIRDFGFSFFIQGDFVLSSSREDIHTDLPWNIRIRDAIPAAFIKSVESFKKSSALATSFLRYVPGEKDVLDDFFKPVVARIVAGLKQTDCVLGRSGRWLRPERILRTSDEFRELFTSDDVLKLFGRDYANQEIDELILARLGAHPIQFPEIGEVFGKHSDWFVSRTTEWKAQFFAYLASRQNQDPAVKVFSTLACIPTAEGRLANPSTEPVFFPLNSRKKYGFENELVIVDADFLEKAVALSSDVEAFLMRLGVKRDDPNEMIRSHIFLRHANGAREKCEPGALIGHIRYVKDKLEQYLEVARAQGCEQQALAELRTKLAVRTKDEPGGDWMFDTPDRLYVGKEYKPEFCIESLAGDALDPYWIVSSDYLPKRRKSIDDGAWDAELKSWRDFFFRIGAMKTPRLTSVSGTGDFECSEELRALLCSPQAEVRRAVLQCLDGNWSAYEGQTRYVARVNRNLNVQKQTRFVEELRATVVPTRKRVNTPLSQAYLDTPEIKEVLGSKLPFVEVALKNEKFIDACGIASRPDVKACTKRLEQLRASDQYHLRDVQKVYRRLDVLLAANRDRIVEAFAKEPLTLVRTATGHAWHRLTEVCWRQAGVALIDERVPSLQGQYEEFHSFFRKLGVATVPPAELWIEALARLPAVEDEERPLAAYSIYRHLSQTLQHSAPNGRTAAELPDWLERFEHEALFLNHRGELVENDELLFLNDDPAFGELFATAPEISLLAVHVDQLPPLANLLEAVAIQHLSKAVTARVKNEGSGQKNSLFTAAIRERFLCIARAVYKQSHGAFEIAIKQGLFERLRQLEVVNVPKLTLEVSLGSLVRHLSGDVEISGNQLLVRPETKSLTFRISAKLCELLRVNPTLADVFTVVLSARTLREAEDELEVRRVPRLPPLEMKTLQEGFPAEDKSGGWTPEPPPEEEESDELHEGSSGATDATNDVSIDAGGGGNAEPVGQGVESSASRGRGPGANPVFQERDEEDRTPAEAGGETGSSGRVAQELGRTESPGTVVKGPTGAAERIPSAASDNSRESDAEGEAPQGEAQVNEPEAIQEAPGATRHGGGYSPRNGSPRRHRTQSGSRARYTEKGRLRSYAEGPDDEEGPIEERDLEAKLNEHKTAVERAAVELAIRELRTRWSALVKMPPNNPGFDILAKTHLGEDEFIEVKGRGGAWTEEGVALTRTELKKAEAAREKYWLCVVEHATDANRARLYLFKDPFGRTREFRFDSGWKGAGITTTGRPERPEPGFFVAIPGKGRAKIVAVKRSREFAKMELQFEDGHIELGVIFKPSKMPLSVD